MEHTNPRVLRFREYADGACEDAGVLIETTEDAHVLFRNQKLYAYFVVPVMGTSHGVIRITLGSRYPDPLHKLVHEFGHFLQWSEGAVVWLVNEHIRERYAQCAARKKKIPARERAALCSSIRDLELDCERRAVEIIRTWELPLDIDEYVQYANAHIWWHTLAIEHARNGGHHFERIARTPQWTVPLCPNKFLENYDDVPEFYRLACMSKSLPPLT